MRQQISVNEFKTKSILLALLLYKTVIEFIYIYSISPIYSYSGLTLNINKIGLLISTLYLLIIVSFSPKDKKRPSTYLFVIMEVFIFTPTLSYYWLNNQSIVYTSFIVVSSIIISMILKMKLSPIRIKEKYAKVWLNYIFVIYILITVYLVIKRGGIDSRAFDFNSIYELRSENDISGIMGYLVNWCAKVFSPFFYVYFYYRNQKWILLPILALQLLLYLSFGNKAFLFSIALLVMSVIITKRGKFNKEFIFAVTGINVVAYLVDVLNISESLRRAIPYRMVFIPVQIQFRYYEFFSVRDKMSFSETIVGKIFSIVSPYPEGISYFISSYYSTTGTYGNANTGIFSDAYANGGFLWMMIFAILLASIFRLIDATTSKLPLYVVVGTFSYMMFVLNDTSLLTSLLTGGMGIMIFLLLLFNSNIQECDSYESNVRYKKVNGI